RASCKSQQCAALGAKYRETVVSNMRNEDARSLGVQQHLARWGYRRRPQAQVAKGSREWQVARAARTSCLSRAGREGEDNGIYETVVYSVGTSCMDNGISPTLGETAHAALGGGFAKILSQRLPPYEQYTGR
ncbi:unnamed protein product, partial [Cladocopium goreaui]